MPDTQNTHDPRAEYAVWPGDEHACARVVCPDHGEHACWYLADIETGAVAVLAPWAYGLPRRRRG